MQGRAVDGISPGIQKEDNFTKLFLHFLDETFILSELSDSFPCPFPPHPFKLIVKFIAQSQLLVKKPTH